MAQELRNTKMKVKLYTVYVKLLGVLLLLSPSSETVNKPRENPDHVRYFSPSGFRTAIFSRGCLAVFFRLTKRKRENLLREILK